ncbi:hypothetical protein DMENIID0001_024110 [Sergentomyia squamirostris]
MELLRRSAPGPAKDQQPSRGLAQRFFDNRVGCSKPNIWKFITKMKQQQVLTELRIQQREQGHEDAPSKKTQERNTRLKKIVSSYSATDRMYYLEKIANYLIDTEDE